MYEFVIMLSDFGVDYVFGAAGGAFNAKRYGTKPGTVTYSKRDRAQEGQNLGNRSLWYCLQGTIFTFMVCVFVRVLCVSSTILFISLTCN